MYVKNENEATRRLYTDAIEALDEPVVFSSDGVARVTADVGEALVEHYDSIVLEDDERGDDTDTETDT